MNDLHAGKAFYCGYRIIDGTIVYYDNAA
ncbi:hypothetical protein MARINON1_52041 [Marinobacter salarius]|nr:hypothetical protein MARINON1_52041 [Marinobacter salarius]